MLRTSLHSLTKNTWVPLHEDSMSSPLPPETITLNATELKRNNNKSTSEQHQRSLPPYGSQNISTMLRKCDETELTVIYCNYMASTSKKQDYVSLSGCLLFGDKQKFQHFLKNFGNEFLINIYLDGELLNYEDKNPLDWLIQLNKTQKQITIQNISENVTHIISLLDQNTTTMPSPEIVKEMSQKNNAVTISPQKDYELGMHSKNISWCQPEELDDSDSAQRNLENFSDGSNSPQSTSSNKQTVQKNLQPLKINIPKQSKPPKCEKEKPTCKAKRILKRKLENEEEVEVENKGFNIDGDMAKFLEHLDHHTKDLFQSTKEVLDENSPIIYNSLATVKSFISLLGKIIKKIPHEIDPISGEIALKYKGCLLHCPPNWSLTSPPGQPAANSIKKRKK